MLDILSFYFLITNSGQGQKVSEAMRLMLAESVFPSIISQGSHVQPPLV
jgi:hypothetical protein